MGRTIDYVDNLLLTDAIRNAGALLFIGTNANVQRGNFAEGPFASLKTDAARWHSLSLWVKSNSIQYAYGGVPFTIVRLNRISTIGEMDVIAHLWSTQYNKQALERPIDCEYGLAAYVTPEWLQNTGILAQYLCVRGQYEPL